MAPFSPREAHVNGEVVEYVRSGDGPTLVLLHGYPQTWYEYRAVIPGLAEHFTVIVPSLRGAGGSSAPSDGYDKRTMAQDLRALLTDLGLEQEIRLVGHDIGSMVAYAYAAQYRDGVAALVLSEAPIPDPGIYEFPSLTPAGPGLWNFGFFSLANGLPEAMVQGREQVWVERFIGAMAVRHERAADPGAVREYARHLADPDHLRASFEWFRTLAQDVADNRAFAERPLSMPVLAVGAEQSLGQAVSDQVRRYATDVRGEVVADSGHWIFEERPEEMTRLLLDFLR
ncbi:alpha/beta hydrolase [Streptomyces sp. WAC 06738]|uniref:alpha/beta fold hydrolase n=1 Tax=Streptomyces sp. WAC 06738 TaxID=2203210 RepID=UPI000F70799B|nr:alpha/beta hydrolase [Streptomyces sp. WAC 06738]AZM48601.1 alpha/beta hydrolase [Streptomyces sp. WAC 06738]